MKNNSNKTSKANDYASHKEEAKLIFQKAEEKVSGTQLNLLPDQHIIYDRLNPSVLNDIVNPALSHRLYYGIQRLLKDNLPKDKKARKWVNDEKLLFLNQGERIKPNGVRGSDSRMAPPETILNEAFAIVTKWIMSGANAYDLYLAFRERNEELGYHNTMKVSSENDTEINQSNNI